MSLSQIMRNHAIQLTPEERVVAKKVFGSVICGIDEKNQSRFVKFWWKVLSLEPGEIAEISTKIPRSGPFHRFHMAMEQRVFNAQDRFEQFEQFRNWVKIGAGHVTWVPGAKGGIVPLPKSISYTEMDEPEMREFHASVMAFFRGPHAAPYLWKHLAEKSHDMMNSMLEGFDK